MGPPPGASPPMRMTASWSGSNDPTAYKSVARRYAPHGELPSDSQQTDKQAPTRHRTQCKKPFAVHRRSACSGVKARRNTSAARRQAAKLCYRFGPLNPSARSANRIAGDGTKNGFPAPNKEPAPNQKRLLDRKSPIQVRIHLPPAESSANQGFLSCRVRSGAGRGSISRPVEVASGSPNHRAGLLGTAFDAGKADRSRSQTQEAVASTPTPEVVAPPREAAWPQTAIGSRGSPRDLTALDTDPR